MKPRFVIIALLPALLMPGMFLPLAAFAQVQFRSTSTFTNGASYGSYYGYGPRGDVISSEVDQLPPTASEILMMPILFGVAPSNLSPNFGDPRPNGRTHQGEDILAPRDSLIISPTQAVVLEVGTGSSSGNYVATANPGGEKFVYMHLDKMSTLSAGDMLQPGDLIGYVGNTGDAAGGPTHLHFEIWKNGVATDPFPRLKGEFFLAQKITFVANIFAHSTDKATLAQLLVTNSRGQFVAAQAAGITLPPEITAEMLRAPAEGVGTGTTSGILAPDDLALGSSGAAVVTLQNFLIAQNKGPAAHALANAGATGNFGPITVSALAEYQAALGITPADGYYGPLTRAYVQNTKPSASVPVVPAPPVTTLPPAPAVLKPAAPPTASSMPTHDLELGARGGDVAWLQNFLIGLNIGSAAQALAEAEATGYFGAVTRAALVEYQRKAGIVPAAGYFGPVTRAHMTSVGI